jgi:hypothetical protein
MTNIKGESAWTPVENSYNQFLIFELGGRKKIKRVTTAGRARSREFVTEYIIQFSDDGELWNSLTDPNKEIQVLI